MRQYPVGRSNFWHPPAWKWIVFLILISFSGFLLFRKPSPALVPVELLPAPDSKPDWNGSYPYLVISLSNLKSSEANFKSSITLNTPSLRHDSPMNESQVDLHSGRFVLRQTDFFIPGDPPLALVRTYTVWDGSTRAFGSGTNHPYDICPTGSRNPYTYMDLNLEDDQQVHFRRISKGTGWADAVYRHDETSSEFYGSQIAWNGDGWTLDFRDGRRFFFPEAYHATNYAQGAPLRMCDARKQCVELRRDERRNLQQVISPSGSIINFKYDQTNRIIEAQSDSGDIRKYSYDSSGHLDTVADGSHLLYRFQYTALLHSPGYDSYLMTAILDGRGNVLLKNDYHDGRVSQQTTHNGAIYRYDYLFVQREIVQTWVEDSMGRRKFYFQSGRFLKEE
jgi:hypothetical protein